MTQAISEATTQTLTASAQTTPALTTPALTTPSLTFADLRDIVEPEAVPLWPLAPGLLIILGIVLLWVGIALAIVVIRRRRNAYRRMGLALLSEISSRYDETGDKAGALREISELLKRVALAVFPRSDVAPLCGSPWLEFLDRSAPGVDFSHGAGEWLGRIPTAGNDELAAISDSDFEKLLDLASRWIRLHRRPEST